MSLAVTERRKYEKVWRDPRYAEYSPGRSAVPLFRSMVRRKGTLLDIGCGTGAAGQALDDAGWSVTYLDFVKATYQTPFIKQNLWTTWNLVQWASTSPYKVSSVAHWQYGYCCDVMEHIPPEKVEAVLSNITKYCDRCFFTIAFNPDKFGKEIGETLHMTVKPFTWWRDLLWRFGNLKDARDLIGQGTFYLAS